MSRRVYFDPPCPTVEVDNYRVGQLAAEHFLERGFKNFAFSGHRAIRFSAEREAGFCTAIREAGFEVSCYYVQQDHPFETDAQQWYYDRRVQGWLSELSKPVGIFVADDVFGAELTGVCQEIKSCVPSDVAIVGVGDDELYCSLARPTLSSVMLNGERIGYETGRQMDLLLSGGEPPKQSILMQPESIHTRQSTNVLAIKDKEVVKASQFIHEYFHLPITVNDVVKVVPASRRSLELHFQRALGRGISKEICYQRLKYCKQLLRETDLKMSSIAKHSGFSSPRHLAMVFQREVGISPTEFRKRARFPGNDS